MKSILKVIAIGLGAVGAAVGTKELVSRLTYEQVQSENLNDKEVFRLGFIDPLKAAMKGGSCEARSAAFTLFMGAAAQLGKVEGDIEDYFGTDDDQLVREYVPAMRDQCTKEAYDECVEKHDFSRLLLLGQDRARQDALIDRNEADETYDALVEKCLSFELEFESVTEVPLMGLVIRAKSLVPLARDRTADPSELVLSGEAPLTPEMRADLPTRQFCSQSNEGPTPKEPFRALKVTLWPDTTGRGALEKEGARIESVRRALAAEEKEGKAASPADITRRDSVRKALSRDESTHKADLGKRAGKHMNRPRRIELSFVIGAISARVLQHCKGVTMPVDVGHLYQTVDGSFAKDTDKTGVPLVVFERDEIRGGDLFARKIVQRRGPERTVSLTFTLWHRPPRSGSRSGA